LNQKEDPVSANLQADVGKNEVDSSSVAATEQSNVKGNGKDDPVSEHLQAEKNEGDSTVEFPYATTTAFFSPGQKRTIKSIKKGQEFRAFA
jgi:hypothetical protein